jgi:hypothetical protein
LEKPHKRPIEREEMLARVALKRLQINKFMALVDEGVGPMVAATVIALSVRLAFSIFINLTVAQGMFLGKIPSYSTLAQVYPRTLIESVTLVCLANAGQSLKNEVNLSYCISVNYPSYNTLLQAIKGQLLLDTIITSSYSLPPFIIYQVICLFVALIAINWLFLNARFANAIKFLPWTK